MNTVYVTAERCAITTVVVPCCVCQPRPRQKTDGTLKWGKWRELNKRLLTKAGAGKGKRMLFPKASNSQEAINWAGKKWLPEPGEHSCRRRSSNKSWNFPRSYRSYRLFLSVSYMYLASKELASVLLSSLHCFFKSCLGMIESEVVRIRGSSERVMTSIFQEK